jgi:hypothetical protein
MEVFNGIQGKIERCAALLQPWKKNMDPQIKNPVINRLTGSEAMSNAIRRGGVVCFQISIKY